EPLERPIGLDDREGVAGRVDDRDPLGDLVEQEPPELRLVRLGHRARRHTLSVVGAAGVPSRAMSGPSRPPPYLLRPTAPRDRRRERSLAACLAAPPMPPTGSLSSPGRPRRCGH